jgi:hypothetical protein
MFVGETRQLEETMVANSIQIVPLRMEVAAPVSAPNLTYDDDNGEIGDICSWQAKQLGVYTVQLEWSDAAGRCI